MMLISLATALLLSQAAPADTTSRALVVPADAFADAGARELFQGARTRQATTAREVSAYTAVARERISAGLRAVGRERLMYRRDMAARVHWRRGETGKIELLGAREAIPIANREVRQVSGAGNEAASLFFDPADERLFTDIISSDGFFVHPLSRAGAAYYRFRSGDTTTLRLEDGTTVRLVELQVIPRRKDSRLFQGSVWLDAATFAPVRTIFRLARPFDFDLDRNRLPDESGDDDDDVPGFMKPIRADIRFITIEYALWNGRWWLPRLVALDGLAEAGPLPGLPFRYERGYTIEDVRGDAAAPPRSATAEPDSCPKRTRSITLGAGSSGVGVDVSSSAAAADSAAAGSADEPPVACSCRQGRCHRFVVSLPADTASLLHSQYLPPSIFASGEELVTGESVDRVLAELESLAPAPWGFQSPTIRWSVAQPGLLRYNRVEGLSVGARVEADFGLFSADATARIGIAEGEPGLEVGAERTGFNRQWRVAAYRRLAAFDPGTRPFGLGNSLSGLLFGSDNGDYFRALGIELRGAPAPAATQWYDWRLYAERQRAVSKQTDWSVPHLFDGAEDFRLILPAQRADQLGAEVTLRAQRGLNPVGWRGVAELGTKAETGDFAFVRPSLNLFGSAPLPGALVGSLELAGGSSGGEVPLQSLWLLGGPGTVRGYGPAEAIGDAFWRTRTEVATAAPGARLVLFSDAGWAGPREAFSFSDDVLLSAGAGVSFLDGLVRLDLARALRGNTGWGLSLYVGSGL